MAGRPNKYETNVKPRFEEIRVWARIGATDKEIAKNLDVNERVFCKYKKQYNQLSELLKSARQGAVADIKAALFKKAVGFSYSERKVIRKQIVLDGEDEASIPATVVQTEEYQKYSLPDSTAALILLKHWDNNTEWTSDPASLKLKKDELALKKQHLENEGW